MGNDSATEEKKKTRGCGINHRRKTKSRIKGREIEGNTK